MGNPPANVGFNPWSSKTPQVIEWQSLCLTTPKPVLRSLGAAATEAMDPRNRALQQEKSPQHEARIPQLQRSPCYPQLEKSSSSTEDPAQPKINALKTSKGLCEPQFTCASPEIAECISAHFGDGCIFVLENENYGS